MGDNESSSSPDQTLVCAASDPATQNASGGAGSASNACGPQNSTPAAAPPPQTGHIGVLVKDCSGAALKDVNVAVFGQGWNGVTDASGSFDFGDVPPGNYTVTGLLDARSTPASQTLAVPAGQTTLFNLVICAIKIEIQINNTGTAPDDIVQLKCTHPAHRHKVPCQIKLVSGAAHDHQITLGNPDGRLRFPEVGDTTKNVTLPVSGAWVAFEISGENASAAIGDAVIEAKLAAVCPDGGASAVGDLKGSKPGTVFWFDAAQMTLTQGGNYTLVGGAGGNYTVAGGVATSFSAQATIKPAGIDCTTPQVKDLRIGIMQESSNFIIAITWDTPNIVWRAATPSGTNIVVPTTMRQTTTYAAAVSQPVNDGLTAAQQPPAGAYPLYDKSATALKPPIGCAGGAASTSSDTPGQGTAATLAQPWPTASPVADVTWTNFVNTTRTENFRTCCVVFNNATQVYCALREAHWEVSVDSAGTAADQHSTVHADQAVAADPSTGVQANNAASTTTTAAVGGATVNQNKP